MTSPTPFSDEVAQRRAAEFHCTIEYANDHVLQLDIDSDDAFQDFEQRFTALLQWDAIPVEPEYSVRWSRRGSRHVTVRLKAPLPMLERITLQSLLGSDPRREMLCYVGIKKGQQNPILFYRPNSVQDIAFRGPRMEYTFDAETTPF